MRTRKPRSLRCRSGAFTLIELMVVVAIIGLLLAIMAPSLRRAKAQAITTCCLVNLHHLGLAAQLYLDANDGYYWPYYTDAADGSGRAWWFGFEEGFPNGGRNRPLDKTRWALADYLGTTDDALECPRFPWDSPHYYPKFAGRMATYGYNRRLGSTPGAPARRREHFAGRSSDVFLLADAVHYDFKINKRFNAGHYIEFSPGRGPGGYAHYRHDDRANILYLDSHAASLERHVPPAWGIAANGVPGNLANPAGPDSIYGF